MPASGRKLDNWIQSYLTYTANLEAPAEFHFWAGVFGIGSALQGKCWFDMGLFKWRPNFYLVFVAPPGIATKSTTVGAAEELLRELPTITFGPGTATWQALFGSFVEAQKEDIVRNAHTPLQKVTHSSISITVSELGNFLDLQDNQLIDFLVDQWDGRQTPNVYKTKGGGEVSFRLPCLNLIGATTPSWMRGNMPEYMIMGGLTSRMLFIHANKKRHLVPYPFASSDKPADQLRDDLLHDLNKIHMLSGQFILSKDAQEKGAEWYTQHWTNIPKHLRDERLQGYASRKQAHLHKLAMVMSAARGDSMVITLEDLEGALTMLGSIESTMAETFNSVVDNQGVKHLATLLAVLKAEKKLDKRSLFRICCTRMDYRNYENALSGILAGGYAREVVSGSTVSIEYVGV
jgi:hypothetical protein